MLRRFLVQPPGVQPGKEAEARGLEQSGDTARAWPALASGSVECGRAHGTANTLPGPERCPVSNGVTEPMHTLDAGADGSVAVSVPASRRVPSSSRPQTPSLTNRRGGILDLQSVGRAHGQHLMLRVSVHPLPGEDGHLRWTREAPHGPGLGLGPLPWDKQHPHGTPSPLQLPGMGHLQAGGLLSCPAHATDASPQPEPPRLPDGHAASWQAAQCVGSQVLR